MELPEREQPHGEQVAAAGSLPTKRATLSAERAEARALAERDLDVNLSLHDWMSLSLSDRLRLVSRDMSVSAATHAPEATMNDRVETLSYDEQMRFALELSKKEAAAAEAAAKEAAALETAVREEAAREAAEREASRHLGAAALDPPAAPANDTDEDDELSKAMWLSLLPEEQASDDIRELMMVTEASLLTEMQEKQHRPFDAVASHVPRSDVVVVNNVTALPNPAEQHAGAAARPLPDPSEEDAMVELAIKMSLQESTTKGVKPKKGDPRPIFIDGNNVAFHHGNHEKFSADGLLNCFNYFNNLGHDKIVIFATDSRKISGSDRDTCDRLNKAAILTWVPSGRTYDDLTLLDHAIKHDGIVVSNDKFRDVQRDYPEYENFIKKRVTSYTFALGEFNLPPDPLGRGGPKREQFLRF